MRKKIFAIIVIIGIIGSLSFFLNSYFSHNNSSLEKQEKIINDHQEENIQEDHDYFPFLDNIIVNLIIFLLLFVIAFRFVHHYDSSPVKKNNYRSTILDETGKINKSVFRKIGIYNGQRDVIETDIFFLYHEIKEGEENLINTNINEINNNENLELKQILISPSSSNLINSKNNNPSSKYVFRNFDREKCEYILSYNKKKLIVKPEEMENILNLSIAEEQKEIFFHDNFGNEKNCYADNEEVKNFCSENGREPSFKKYVGRFQGKTSYFNLYNFIAFLSTFFFFLLSFGIPYFILYFFFAFLYALIFIDQETIEEKNKWLFAFHKAWQAILLLNFRSFSKIIPILCFFAVSIFDGYLFFGRHMVFFPAVYDEKNGRLMLIYQLGYKKFKNFLEGKLIEIEIDSFYPGTYLSDTKKTAAQINPDPKNLTNLNNIK